MKQGGYMWSRCLEKAGVQIPGMSSKVSELFVLIFLVVAFENTYWPQAEMETLKQGYKCRFLII